MYKHFVLMLSLVVVCGCGDSIEPESNPANPKPDVKKESDSKPETKKEVPKESSKNEKTKTAKVDAKNRDWSDLRGTITFNGDFVPPPPLKEKGESVANAEVCTANDIPDEELLVDPKSKGIANCVIWLDRSRSLKIHPDLKIPGDIEVTVDNKNCRFVPRIVVCRTDQVLRAINSDNCSHNVKTNFIKNKNDNPILPPKNVVGMTFKFTESEILPMPIECNIHSWMKGYCHVLDHPYFAVTDKDGKFEIKNLPIGMHKFIIWHEKAGFLTRKHQIEIQAGKTFEENLSYDKNNFK